MKTQFGKITRSLDSMLDAIYGFAQAHQVSTLHDREGAMMSESEMDAYLKYLKNNFSKKLLVVLVQINYLRNKSKYIKTAAGIAAYRKHKVIYAQKLTEIIAQLSSIEHLIPADSTNAKERAILAEIKRQKNICIFLLGKDDRPVLEKIHALDSTYISLPASLRSVYAEDYKLANTGYTLQLIDVIESINQDLFKAYQSSRSEESLHQLFYFSSTTIPALIKQMIFSSTNMDERVLNLDRAIYMARILMERGNIDVAMQIISVFYGSTIISDELLEVYFQNISYENRKFYNNFIAKYIKFDSDSAVVVKQKKDNLAAEITHKMLNGVVVVPPLHEYKREIVLAKNHYEKAKSDYKTIDAINTLIKEGSGVRLIELIRMATALLDDPDQFEDAIKKPILDQLKAEFFPDAAEGDLDQYFNVLLQLANDKTGLSLDELCKNHLAVANDNIIKATMKVKMIERDYESIFSQKMPSGKRVDLITKQQLSMSLLDSPLFLDREDRVEIEASVKKVTDEAFKQKEFKDRPAKQAEYARVTKNDHVRDKLDDKHYKMVRVIPATTPSKIIKQLKGYCFTRKTVAKPAPKVATYSMFARGRYASVRRPRKQFSQRMGR